VGADIGIHLFRILSQASAASAEQLLVYVNPRDAVLEEATELTQQVRVGVTGLDRPIPSLSEQFTFVELDDPVVPRGPKPVKQLLVRHNPLHDERILHHACRFLGTGRITEETDTIEVRQRTGGKFRGSEAGYYSIHMKSEGFRNALNPVRLLR